METLLRRACPVCETSEAEVLHRQSFGALLGLDLASFEQTLAACARCGALHVRDYLTPAQLERYYASLSSYEYLASEQELPAEERQRSEQQHRFLRPYLQGASKVLDVGCSTGHTLALFRDEGHAVHGIEPSGVLSELARRRYGLTVDTLFVGPDTELPAGQDLVMLSHVLEHLMEPREMLAAIRRALSPRGLLFIEIPVIELFDERDLFQLSFEHVNYFSAGSLSNLMHQCGFRQVEQQVFENEDGTSPHYPTLGSLWERDEGRDWPLVDRRRHDEAVLRRYLKLVNAHKAGTEARIAAALALPGGLAIWGAGTLSAQLLERTALAGRRDRLLGLLDVDPKKAGQTLQGLTVHGPDSPSGQALLAQAAAVLIGSWSSQEAIHQALLKRGLPESRIVRLFDVPPH